MRVTGQTLLRNSLRHIQNHFQTLSRNQEMLASGIRVAKPSDDPIAAQRILRWRKVEDGISQYQRNIDNAKIWMNTTESVISSVNGIVETIHELALQGGNSLVPDEVRSGFTNEVEALLKQVVSLANTAVDNNSLFAGHITDTKPFTVTTGAGGLITAVTYNGDGGQRNIEISEGNSFTVNSLGSNENDLTYNGVFRDNNLNIDVFQTLIDLRDDLAAGNVSNINDLRLPEIEEMMENLAVAQSTIGLKLNAITLSGDILSKELIDVQEEIANNEQSDYAKVVSDISYEQTLYQAALTSTGNLIQGSLFDFLR